MRNAGARNLMSASLKPDEIEGTYFTYRYTKGDMVLKFVNLKTGFATFAAAAKFADEEEAA